MNTTHLVQGLFVKKKKAFYLNIFLGFFIINEKMIMLCIIYIIYTIK